MINAKNLSEFLTRNVHPDLYPQLFVISRNGKLVAYSSPVDITQIEDQAALVAMAWKDSTNKLQTTTTTTTTTTARPELAGLSVESDTHNILVRPIQANLLLVLVGGLPPGAPAQRFRITPERRGDDKPLSPGAKRLEDDIVALTAGADPADSGLRALRVQRRKLDMLAETVLGEATRLHMPDDAQNWKPFA